ncbi:two-component system response regulator [Halobacteriovorax sp. HLS]|uniref:response regulator n=1 Tax=Halobacteriovorax sp. HLS TaxID=2234000 RepID=UPI000FDBFA5E|nr:response regulator [Halobacteriovorax sp. HLS]
MLNISKSILVVDDDQDMQTYIKKILSNLGYEILLSNNTEDAFAMVLDHCPHLILLDINLEDDYGFSLLEKMKQVNLIGKINVYMISSQTNKQSITLSKEYGVNGYLLKPLNNQTLINTAKASVKDHSFTPIDFSNEQEDIELDIPGEIIKLNEVSFTFRSKVKFTQKSKVEIESTFLKSLSIMPGHFTIYQQSRDIMPGLYDTVIQLLGLPEKTLQNIRKVQNKKV